MSKVSPPPTSAPFPIPPIASSPPATQPNATTPPVSSIPPLLPPLPAPKTNVTSPMASPPTPSAPPTNEPPPTFSPPPLPSSPPPTTPPSPPANSPPPPQSSPPPASQPPPQSSPPPASEPPPQSSPPPASSPPPPKVEPPPVSPPPEPTPPSSSPPPPTKADPPPPPKVDPPPPPKVDPPPISPPPQPTTPPSSSPPPPKVDPPPPAEKPSPPPAPPSPPQSPEPPQGSSPPPPSPGNSPPLPAPTPPNGSPLTPASDPPKNSPPSPPSPPSSENSPPSPPVTPSQGSPPTPPSDPGSSRSPPAPSDGTTTNRSSHNPPGSSNNQSSGGIGTGGTLAIGIILAVLLLGIIGAVSWCIWKRKKKAFRLNGGNVIPTSVGGSTPSPRSDSVLLKIQESNPEVGKGTGSNFLNSPADGLGNPKIWFTYEELVTATADFSAENLLGQGGFGKVHKGRLEDGRDVAVKQLEIGGSQGDREFRAEVEIISRVHHRHLVSLVGYCISENRRLLVYDYVPNNTLYFHLHAEGRPVMDWAMRVKIAVGAARGIAYLHEDCNPRIIHRDIKSSNILLDSNFEARVSDFGLAKLAQDANTHVTTRVVGTFGYMAPEYASSGKLTEKSDIYSFGVVLLELITGRKPVDTSQPIGEESLVEWARPLLNHALEKGEFDQLADPRLERNYIATEMFQLIEAAAACVRHSAAKRPAMGQITRAFDSMSLSDLSNGMKVGESTIYNSAEQSAEIRLFRRMAFGSPDFSSDFFSQGTQHSGESAEDRV